VELYARVRRAVLVEGKSRRAVARELGLARKTVSKMLEYSLPPGYRRRVPISMSTKTYKTRNRAVTTTRKSQASSACA